MTEKQRFIKGLYEDNHDYLLRISCIFSRSEADAEDLVQNVFVLATDSCDKLMTHKNPRAWLVVTLRNCIRNDRRLHANTKNVSLEEIGDLTAPEAAEPLSYILPGRLSVDDKDILIWRFERKLSYREMSKKLGISETACRVKVCRIIKKCRELMEQ